MIRTKGINGISKVERDTAFDSKQLLAAASDCPITASSRWPPDLKEGVLLEAGFDVVTPKHRRISAPGLRPRGDQGRRDYRQPRQGGGCYDPGHTLVEKLQTISTKYRQWEEKKEFPVNFMRHYYDVYSLLQCPEVQAFFFLSLAPTRTRRTRQSGFDRATIPNHREPSLHLE